MGRKKIKIEPIQEGRNRQVTYLKRKAGLFKKAYELATLTDSKVAVIVFGHNGKLSQFCSGDIDQLLLKYTEFDGVVESKGPSDFSSLKDDDDDGSEEGVQEEDDKSSGCQAGGSGTGGRGEKGDRGGPGGGIAGQGPPSELSAGDLRGAASGCGYSHGSADNQNTSPQEKQSSWSGNGKRKKTHKSDFHCSSPASKGGDLVSKRTVKAAVPSNHACIRNDIYSSTDSASAGVEAAGQAEAEAPVTTLDHTSLLAKPAAPHSMVPPSGALTPTLGHESIRLSTGGHDDAYTYPSTAAAAPHAGGQLRASAGTAAGYAPHSSSLHTSPEGSGSYAMPYAGLPHGSNASWHQAGNARRGSLSVPGDTMFSTLMRPLTADGHLEHSTANQLLGLSHQYPVNQHSRFSQRQQTVVTPGGSSTAVTARGPVMSADGLGPGLTASNIYGGTSVSQCGLGSSTPSLQAADSSAPHQSSLFPMGCSSSSSSSSSSIDASGPYAHSGSGSGASVSSSSLSMSRPGTDEYFSGSASSTVQTPLLASALTVNGPSNDSALSNALAASHFLGGGGGGGQLSGANLASAPVHPKVSESSLNVGEFSNSTASALHAGCPGMLPSPGQTQHRQHGIVQHPYQPQGHPQQVATVPATAQTFLPSVPPSVGPHFHRP